MSTIDELEALEAQEELVQAAASVNPDVPLGAEVVDWSFAWSSPRAGGAS